MEGTDYAVLQTSVKPMKWEDLETNFIDEFTLSEDFDKCHVLLEMTLIIHPLGVFHDHGGDCRKFFAVLPNQTGLVILVTRSSIHTHRTGGQ